MSPREHTGDNREQLPNSAICILKVLDYEGPELSRQELLEKTDLHERTLTRALNTLQNGGYISKERKKDDLREVVVKMSTKRSLNPRHPDRSN